ncbi:MAG: GTP 3',8-cyclase [Bacteroidia bacterium]|nr:MAG: GTP 3',8-cyclase [Bacteroidia bacterium]
MLRDSYQRVHDYLRISITDKCNFSCTYCIPIKNCHFLPNEKLMTVDELFQITRTFVQLGVRKIRLTGGEPLIHPDFLSIVEKLHQLNIELALTTNGYYLDKYISELIKLGLTSINISLDTLESAKFLKITGKNAFERIYRNIQLLLDKGLHPKINVVLIKGVNDNEIIQFIEWTKQLPIHVRFIEYMPFEANQWNRNYVVELDEILKVAQQKGFSLIKLKDHINSTSKSFQVEGFKGTFAVISTVSNPFCDTCNRLRLTADGKLRNCLFAQNETDLLTPLRNGLDIVPLIQQNVLMKFKVRGGLPDFKNPELNNHLSKRKMIEIGG